MRLAGVSTQRIDLNGRRAIPGLIDSRMHIIREGLNYNMELRWDGVRSLADAMRMLKDQVDRTPAAQWVRVVGGFTEHQFAEKRLPTLDEINAVAPDTPVFILHLYDRGLLNRAALRAVGYTKATPETPGAKIVRDNSGEPTGLLVAKPNAGILYATLAKGPKLPPDYQKNSTQHFLREVNRLSVTGVIDAGGGYQNYPEDYAVIEKLHREGQLTVPIALQPVPAGIADITSVLTLLGGKAVHADAEFKDLAPPLPPPMPDWSPVRTFGGLPKGVPAGASGAGTLSPPHVDAAILAACTGMSTPGDCPALLQTTGHSGERSAAPVGHSREVSVFV
jgi:predicted amidohydrolase YtcJ